MWPGGSREPISGSSRIPTWRQVTMNRTPSKPVNQRPAIAQWPDEPRHKNAEVGPKMTSGAAPSESKAKRVQERRQSKNKAASRCFSRRLLFRLAAETATAKSQKREDALLLLLFGGLLLGGLLLRNLLLCDLLLCDLLLRSFLLRSFLLLGHSTVLRKAENCGRRIDWRQDSMELC